MSLSAQMMMGIPVMIVPLMDIIILPMMAWTMMVMAFVFEVMVMMIRLAWDNLYMLLEGI
jgi:hypothetical protein